MLLCPVPSLSRYFFWYPDVLKSNVSLFEVKQQYTRYATWLTKLVKQLDMQLKILGFEAGDLGSRYCSKGVATMVSSGCTLSPSIVSLWIWEVWVFGRNKDKYVFRNKSGDQYVRSCTSWLEQLKKDFLFPPNILILQDYVKLRN